MQGSHGRLLRGFSMLTEPCRRVRMWPVGRMTCQAAAGLRYLHSQPVPVCHADVKGSNILVDAGLTAKLNDFGLSTFNNAAARQRATGTWLWMAPELVESVEPHANTTKSDVYSVRPQPTARNKALLMRISG